ncbi:hypothetical protein D3C72_2276920 [compost metagenome]
MVSTVDPEKGPGSTVPLLVSVDLMKIGVGIPSSTLIGTPFAGALPSIVSLEYKLPSALSLTPDGLSLLAEAITLDTPVHVN